MYTFGIPTGGAVGIVFGGFIAHWVDWRTAFIVVGCAGVLIAPVFRFVVREPPRGRYDGARGAGSPAGFREVMRVLLAKHAFWGISFGAAASSMMGYGLFFWLPSFLVRSHGMTLLNASVYFGAIFLFVNNLIDIGHGSVALGVLSDALATRHGADSLRYAILAGTVFYFVAAALFLLAAKRLERDWE